MVQKYMRARKKANGKEEEGHRGQVRTKKEPENARARNCKRVWRECCGVIQYVEFGEYGENAAVREYVREWGYLM